MKIIQIIMEYLNMINFFKLIKDILCHLNYFQYKINQV